MKKILTFVVAVLASATMAHAQFGIIGGWTTTNTSINTKDFKENFKGLNSFHGGIAYHAKLPVGFALQPELTYEMKRATVTENVSEGLISTKSQGIELGLGIQWGVDLLVARPFVVAEPFIGYRFKNDEQFTAGATMDPNKGVEVSKILTEAKNKLEYGFALGAGVDIVRHVQVSVKWFKNLGPVYNNDKLDVNSIYAHTVEEFKDWKNNYGGIKVTLGIFF